jgi:hypothetical protein
MIATTGDPGGSYRTERERSEGLDRERRYERESGYKPSRAGSEEPQRAGSGHAGARESGARHEWDLPGPFRGKGPKGYLAEEITETALGVTDVWNELKLYESRGGTRPGYSPQAEPWRESGSRQEQRFYQERPTKSGRCGHGRGEDYRTRIWVGMDVVDESGRKLGRIKSVVGNEFLLDRSLARDLYVPCDTVRSVGDVVLLGIPEDRVADMDWRKPELWASNR